MWSERFASPSSKEQSYVRGVLNDIKGKGTKSHKLADAVRSNPFDEDPPPTFDEHGKSDVDWLAGGGLWNDLRLLGMKDKVIMERYTEAREHLKSKVDDIADYIED